MNLRSAARLPIQHDRRIMTRSRPHSYSAIAPRTEMPRPRTVLTGLALALGWSSPTALEGQFPETMMYDHVHLAVPDPPAAAAWYSRHFGGEPVDGRNERTLIGTTRFIFRMEANPRP